MDATSLALEQKPAKLSYGTALCGPSLNQKPNDPMPRPLSTGTEPANAQTDTLRSRTNPPLSLQGLHLKQFAARSIPNAVSKHHQHEMGTRGRSSECSKILHPCSPQTLDQDRRPVLQRVTPYRKAKPLRSRTEELQPYC